MAKLVDQINEMINILEAIDPKAAAQFRGRASGNLPGAPSPSVQPPPDAWGQSSLPRAQAPRVQAPPRHEHTTQDLPPNPLKLNLTANNLIQGIVLSEILGKPVSRRHRRRM
ncbi:MAG: hypothetical protein PHQ83_07930 [Eubacteriales bacterium]|nr:hypothetical protein [Eubacteriales bacterium]